jgi:hypothetical protein
MQFGDVFAYALGFSNAKNCGDNVSNMEKYTGRYFGVFAGVTRSVRHTLPSWPVNIHGSIGYWDEEFNMVSPVDLCNHAFRVAFDAVFHDDRRRYFPELLTDVNAVLDIKFMCMPVRDVDAATGKFVDDGSMFSNNTWGLIVQNNVHRATYLPGVYMDTPWNAIKASVQSKAKVMRGEKARFIAYRTKRTSATLKQIYEYLLRASPSLVIKALGCHFISFSNTCQHVPYSVTADKQILYDESQDVRNVASLLDIQQLAELVPCKTNLFESDIKHYIIKYISRPAAMRQASTFLLTLLRHKKKSPRLQRCIAGHLISGLSSMESEFELGEALVALQMQVQMRTPQSIFELNWQAQASPRTELRYQLRTFMADFTRSTETNILAVAFEAACALRMHASIASLFSHLMRRYDAERGLFMFRDGSARIDITGHVHRGLMMLASSITSNASKSY